MRDDARQYAYRRKRWKRARAAQLAREPYCECPECSGLPLLQRPRADVVHHVDGLGPEGPAGYDPDNLQSLYKPHHDRITAARPPKTREPEEHPGLVG